MRRSSVAFATVCLIAVPMLLASGCTQHQTRDEAKQAAKDRWQSARSGIMFSLAQQKFEVGDLEQAKKKVNQVLKADPDHVGAHVLLAQIALENGKLERAFHTLELALEHDAESYKAHYFMGVVYQRWQEYESALKEYNRAYEIKPDKPDGLIAAAEMLVKLGRTDEAEKKLKGKLKYFDHNAAIRVMLGRIHMLENRYEQAVDHFREAAVLSSNDPNIVEHLAMAEYASQQYSEAIYHLAKLLEKEDYQKRDDLRLALGDCYLATDKPVKARQVYLDVTRNDPNDVNAWIKLAQAAWIVGDASRLRQAAEEIRSLAPKRHEGYVVQGLIERKAGNTEAALKQFERAAGMAPSSALPLILKGMTLQKAGDRNAARAAYEKALDVEPEDPRPKRLLATLEE